MASYAAISADIKTALANRAKMGGIKQVTVGGRTITYESMQDMMDALSQVQRAADAESQASEFVLADLAAVPSTGRLGRMWI